MTFSNKAVYIIGAKRTPFCHYGGFLRELPASQIFAVAAKEAMRSANINSIFVDQTIVGNVYYLSQCDGGKTPRYCGIYSGVPIDRPALGVNKSCGTGLQAIINGAMDLLVGTSNLSLVGGTEIMSTLPLLVRNVRFSTSLGSAYVLEDHIKPKFYDSYCDLTLEEIAEATAKKHKISRIEVEEYIDQSFMRWNKANKSNIFSKELTRLTVNINKKEVLVEADQLRGIKTIKESVSPTTKIINIYSLPGTGNSTEDFNKTEVNHGSMTYNGIRSGRKVHDDFRHFKNIFDLLKLAGDGAAALILASKEAIKAHVLKPLAQVVDWTCVGDDPTDSVAGVVSAIKSLLAKQQLTVNHVDLYEINETFGSDVLVVAKELKLDVNRVNVNGGALAMGHPVAATGARMATHLVHELKRQNLRRGVAASTCGAGQGVALLIERD